MGMSQIPIHGWTISLGELRKLCPVQILTLEAILAESGNTWGSVAKNIQCEEPLPTGFPQALERLEFQFRVVTRVEDSTFSNAVSCLELELGYYDEELGDGGDEVEHTDGAVFLVSGVTVRTPAGEKFKDVVQENLWSVFG